MALVAVAIVAAGIGAGLLFRPSEGSATPSVGASARPAAAGVASTPAASGADAVPSPSDAPGAGDWTGNVPDPAADADATKAVEAMLAPLPDPADVEPVAPFEETKPPKGSLTVGASSDLASQTIGAAGGTIEGGGLKLEFPADAFAADTPVTVTQAPITAADFGGMVTPLTALYTVDAGADDPAAPVTVTLKATVPQGATAMAFYWDEAAGTLIPLTPVSQDATSITAIAPHFSSILGGLLDAAKVPTIVDSGFRPGVDDWQFTNRGSYVAPGGHCEGQSISAMWYYVARKKAVGAPALYGHFDNNEAPEKTPDFWPDDSDAYRLASTVQKDPIGDLFTYLFLRNLGWQQADGRLTYEAFRAAIAQSGQPQMIRISTSPNESGHTMIVYRVTPNWLLIADPNYPGEQRQIRFDPATGKLGPFVSGANATDIANGNNKSYTLFAYVPWRSHSTEATLAGHWAEFEANKAGDTVFPGYDLNVEETDAQGQVTSTPLVNGYRTDKDSVTVVLTPLAGGTPSNLFVFPGTSSERVGPASFRQTLQLSEGANEYGFWVMGRIDGGVNASGNPVVWWKFVEFVRLTINRESAPTPSPTSAPVTAGAWVLDGAPIIVKQDIKDCYIVSESSADGTVTVESGDSVPEECGYPDHWTVTASWSPASLPASIAPGQVLSINLAAKVDKAVDTDAQVSVTAQASGRGTTIKTSIQGAHACVSPSSDLCSASGTGTWNLETEAGSPGDTITVDLQVGVGTYRQLWYQYTYRWQAP